MTGLKADPYVLPILHHLVLTRAHPNKGGNFFPQWCLSHQGFLSKCNQLDDITVKTWDFFHTTWSFSSHYGHHRKAVISHTTHTRNTFNKQLTCWWMSALALPFFSRAPKQADPFTGASVVPLSIRILQLKTLLKVRVFMATHQLQNPVKITGSLPCKHVGHSY